MDKYLVELVKIRNLLNDYFNVKADIANEHIYAESNTIVCCVSAPHEGTDGKWMIRFSPKVSFDRWANSTAIEELFDTCTDLLEFLHYKQAYIYCKLFERLSADYPGEDQWRL